uniref:DNA-binding protein n=1 Tax=Panagrellus redivivus TaxID=6233 RepID=A0A7E4VSW3_PANRE
MPYPLAKLAYGLRCRLNELATPVERYRLQTAAGNASTCPPLQRSIETLNDLNIFYVNEKVTVSGMYGRGSIDYKKYGLVHCGSDYICVINTNAQNVAKPFEYFLHPKEMLYLQDCHLSLPFLEEVAKFIGTTEKICFWGSTNRGYHLNIAIVMTVFPNVKSILFHDSPFDPTWITDTALFDQHNLTRLEFTMTLKEYKTYSVDAIETFLRAQTKGFKLKLIVHDTSRKPNRIDYDLEVALKGKFEKDRPGEGFTQIKLSSDELKTTLYLTDI